MPTIPNHPNSGPRETKYVIPAIIDPIINPVNYSGFISTAAKIAIDRRAIIPYEQNSIGYTNSTLALQDFQGQRSALLGTPIFDSIELSYKNSNYLGSNSNLLGSSLDLAILFEIVKFDVSQTRNIVTTAVNGLNGTIKEFIADGDYVITCKATIAIPGIDYYDYDTMQAISQIFTVQDDLTITSSIINKVFGINNVVITDYKFYQPEIGMRNVQAVDFTMISDDTSNYNLIFK